MIKRSFPLVIIGDSAFAEVAYECFSNDSKYKVVGFAVEQEFYSKTDLFGLPIVKLESLEKFIKSEKTFFYAAQTYSQLNRLRSRTYNLLKSRGYAPASYISSNAFVWKNVKIGEHAFIFEDNTIQPFVNIGNNVVLWSGNHIGHHSVIEDNCFVSSHVVVSGFCTIGKNSFLGVNSTISNNVKIGEDNWIGLGATITRDTQPNSLFKGKQSELSAISSTGFFKVSN